MKKLASNIPLPQYLVLHITTNLQLATDASRSISNAASALLITATGPIDFYLPKHSDIFIF